MTTPAAKNIVRELFALVQLLREQVKAKQHSPALSVVQLQALSFIYKTKNPLMHEVADFLAVRPPSATSLVNTLIRHALVARTFDKRDRRVVRLHLTALGTRLLNTRYQAVTSAFTQKIKILSKAEQATFARLLHSIVNA